jgi:hypothetical protein
MTGFSARYPRIHSRKIRALTHKRKEKENQSHILQYKREVKTGSRMTVIQQT